MTQLQSFERLFAGNTFHNSQNATHFMWLRPVEQRVTVFYENLVIATVRSIVRLTARPQLQLFAFYHRSSGTQHSAIENAARCVEWLV